MLTENRIGDLRKKAQTAQKWNEHYELKTDPAQKKETGQKQC